MYPNPYGFATANRKKRLLNLFIDTIAIAILQFLSAAVLNQPENPAEFDFWLLTIIVFLSYYTISEATTGKTIGKAITKTMVIKKDGLDIDTDTALGRSLLRLIPIDMFTFLGNRSIGSHDIFSKTLVIDIALENAHKKNAVRKNTISPGSNAQIFLNPYPQEGSGYNGGYSGGHNNFGLAETSGASGIPEIPETPPEPDNKGYRKGELYE